MSLLDRRTHAVTFYPEKEQDDSLGNKGQRVPDYENGVTVWGALQPASSSEDNRDGQQVRSLYRFITRGLPAGAFAAAHTDDLGYLDVVGEPLRRSMSAATRHSTVTLQARSARDVA